MARKAKRLTLRKKKSKEETGADTGVYEVEKIVGSHYKGEMLYYNIKWKGYPSEENTSEPEYRLVCDEKVLEYLAERFNKDDYLDRIPTSVESVDKIKNNRNRIIDFIEPLSSIGQMTIFGGSVKFVSTDTISKKVKYLKHVVSCDQSYILHSLLVPGSSEIRRDIEQYQSELDALQNLYVDYPKISIRVPYQVGCTLYSPPPLSNLLFEPVTLEMFNNLDEDKYHFAPKSDTQGFNKVKVFMEGSHLEKLVNKEIKPIDELERLEFGLNPRFDVKLKLTQSVARGWSLVLNQEVSENTPLLLMSGIIRPTEAAQECLEKDGEQVAFSCFIEIPSSGVCLDRRQFHDFSKYIPHSCEPTCGVRLVNSGNSVPDLVVYSLQHIGSSDSYAITLDYFKMFRDDVRAYFGRSPSGHQIFTLYDEKTDFVHCQCGATKCNQVLHIGQTHFARSTEPPKKRSRPSSVNDLPKPMYCGLKLHESNIVYTITDGTFTE